MLLSYLLLVFCLSLVPSPWVVGADDPLLLEYSDYYYDLYYDSPSVETETTGRENTQFLKGNEKRNGKQLQSTPSRSNRNQQSSRKPPPTKISQTRKEPLNVRLQRLLTADNSAAGIILDILEAPQKSQQEILKFLRGVTERIEKERISQLQLNTNKQNHSTVSQNSSKSKTPQSRPSPVRPALTRPTPTRPPPPRPPPTRPQPSRPPTTRSAPTRSSATRSSPPKPPPARSAPVRPAPTRSSPPLPAPSPTLTPVRAPKRSFTSNTGKNVGKQDRNKGNPASQAVTRNSNSNFRSQGNNGRQNESQRQGGGKRINQNTKNNQFENKNNRKQSGKQNQKNTIAGDEAQTPTVSSGLTIEEFLSRYPEVKRLSNRFNDDSGARKGDVSSKKLSSTSRPRPRITPKQRTTRPPLQQVTTHQQNNKKQHNTNIKQQQETNRENEKQEREERKRERELSEQKKREKQEREQRERERELSEQKKREKQERELKERQKREREQREREQRESERREREQRERKQREKEKKDKAHKAKELRERQQRERLRQKQQQKQKVLTTTEISVIPDYNDYDYYYDQLVPEHERFFQLPRTTPSPGTSPPSSPKNKKGFQVFTHFSEGGQKQQERPAPPPVTVKPRKNVVKPKEKPSGGSKTNSISNNAGKHQGSDGPHAGPYGYTEKGSFFTDELFTGFPERIEMVYQGFVWAFSLSYPNQTPVLHGGVHTILKDKVKTESVNLAGDHIVRITGRASPYNINRLTFYTKNGKQFGPWGDRHSEESVDFDVSAPPGHALAFFSGTIDFGVPLRSVSFHWRPIS